MTDIDYEALAKAAHDAYFEGEYDDLPEFEKEMWRNVVNAVLHEPIRTVIESAVAWQMTDSWDGPISERTIALRRAVKALVLHTALAAPGDGATT